MKTFEQIYENIKKCPHCRRSVGQSLYCIACKLNMEEQNNRCMECGEDINLANSIWAPDFIDPNGKTCEVFYCKPCAKDLDLI